MVTASAAIEEKVMPIDTIIDVSGGQIQVDRTRIVHDSHNYGALSFTDVIVMSSNVGAIKIGFKLGTDRLSQYVDNQGTLDALRLRPSSEQPWPAFDNPMLGYLVERAVEIAEDDGLGAAVGWLAANAWFEGAIAERSRFIRLLDAD